MQDQSYSRVIVGGGGRKRSCCCCLGRHDGVCLGGRGDDCDRGHNVVCRSKVVPITLRNTKQDDSDFKRNVEIVKIENRKIARVIRKVVLLPLTRGGTYIRH